MKQLREKEDVEIQWDFVPAFFIFNWTNFDGWAALEALWWGIETDRDGAEERRET